jgi:hypothetical protein
LVISAFALQDYGLAHITPINSSIRNHLQPRQSSEVAWVLGNEGKAFVIRISFDDFFHLCFRDRNRELSARKEAPRRNNEEVEGSGMMLRIQFFRAEIRVE